MIKTPHPGNCIQWPPTVLSVTALGHIRDASGNYYPRDIGRSSEFSNGQIVFQFGDTFCHNRTGEFLSVSNNTCAVTQQTYGVKAPTVTEYLTQYTSSNRKETFDGESSVTNLIEKRSDEANTAATRYKIWSFSGIVEFHSHPGEIRGWTFFEMWKDDLRGGPSDVYQYTGVAEVMASCFAISAKQNERHAHSRELFHMKEPRFGSFCAIADGPWLYAYGHTGDGNRDIVLARVPIDAADDRSKYLFWDGMNWSTHFKKLGTVLRDMQHGQIFKTKMFGPNSIYRYAFVGCNAQGDSAIQMGRASTPQGPWEVFPLDVKTYAFNDPAPGSFRYCMYPHPWACDSSRGDLMITWSEGGMTGGVVAVQVRLKTA